MIEMSTLNAMSCAFANFLNFFLSSSWISLTVRILFMGIDYLGLDWPFSAEGHFNVSSNFELSLKDHHNANILPLKSLGTFL